MKIPASLVLRLIGKARLGDLSLRELPSVWPSDLDGVPFFEAIYDDIQHFLEHYPNDGDFELDVDEPLVGVDAESVDLLEVRRRLLIEGRIPSPEHVLAVLDAVIDKRKRGRTIGA